MTPAMFRDCVERVDLVDAGNGSEPPLFRFWYESAFGVGPVDVRGGNVERWDPEPLRLRRRLALATVVGGTCSALAAARDYNAQDPWFAVYGVGSWILWLAALAGFAAGIAALGWSLPGRARRLIRTWIPTAISAALVLGAIGTAKAVRPEGERAASLLESGDITRARAEAKATLVLEPNSADARRVLDTLHLRAMTSAGSVADAYGIMKEPWLSEEVRVEVLAVLEGRVTRTLSQAVAAGDIGEVGRLVGPASVLDRSVQLSVRRALALLGLRRCLSSGEVSCIPDSIAAARRDGVPEETLAPHAEEARLKLAAAYKEAHEGADGSRDSRSKVQGLARAIAIAEAYEDFAEGDLEPGLVRLRAQHRAATDALHWEERAEAERERQARAREERRAAREAERLRREAAREAARQERAERARSRRYAPLLCCDGTLSPSCTCAGSHRGCCSHHHGVCGCSE